jgi:carbonic anhydrase
MQQLIEGVHKFRHEEFGRRQELFKRLSREGQNPHTLFITCADSRVLAELITQSEPGDLFVVKNIGGMIPSFEAKGSTNSTAAAIEFAVEALKVRDIVVCGHSQCAAVTALMSGLQDEAMPHLNEWLKLAAPVRSVLEREYRHLTREEDRIRAAEEENVLFALENLHTYPGVRSRLEQGALHLHAWFFKIATAELFVYDASLRQFVLLADSEKKE